MMQDTSETMMRGMLAEAFREVAAILDGAGGSERTDWPKLKSPAPNDGAQCFGRADVYVAGCSALSGLAQRLQIPIFEIGATKQPLMTRQSDLCADRYGAAIRKDGRLIQEAGYNDWEMRRLDPIDAPGSGLEFVPRALRVDLTMPFGVFETGLRRALQPHSLSAWATSSAGRAHLKTIGAEESEARRYTLYRFGDDVPSSPCNELYVIRPRIDMPRICEAIRRVSSSQDGD